MNPNPSKIVNVYKNLHLNKWSVRQNGRILFHCDKIILRDCNFRVQPAGRAKVLLQKKKNVHAYISGFLSNTRTCRHYKDDDYKVVTYNPYKYCSFVSVGDFEPIYKADFVDMDVNEGDEAVIAIWKKQ